MNPCVVSGGGGFADDGLTAVTLDPRALRQAHKGRLRLPAALARRRPRTVPLAVPGASLVLVAHGTRDPAGIAVTHSLASLVRLRLPGVDVRVAFADVLAPDLTSVLLACRGPAVVVPAFLASGYHVRVDVPAQAARSGRAVLVTPPIGSDPSLVGAAHERLLAAGWVPGDPVVLAAAGSADSRALADVRLAADRLAAWVGAPVRVGFVAAGAPRLSDVVDSRTAVVSWLLAPGIFYQRVRQSGAAVVAAPLGDHSAVVDLIVARYLARSPL